MSETANDYRHEIKHAVYEFILKGHSSCLVLHFDKVGETNSGEEWSESVDSFFENG